MDNLRKWECACAGMLLAALLVCPFFVQAQIQPQWIYIEKGQGSGEDIAKNITVDQAGNVYAAGWTFPAGHTNTVFTVIKINSTEGKKAWEYLYDGSGDGMNEALAICIDTLSTHAPGIYAAGYTHNEATEFDFTATRLDTNGNMVWEYIYNGPDSFYDCARAITIDPVGGGPVVAGYSGQESGFGVAYTVIALDFDTPTQRWFFCQEYMVSMADDIAQDIVADNSGYVYSTGVFVTPMTQTEDITTIKHRSQGGTQWMKHYLYTPPPPSIDWERGEAIALDFSSGDVYSAGNLSGGPDEPYLMPAVLKYNSSGTFQWIWYNVSYGVGVFRDVVVGNSGYVYAAGNFVVKVDPATGTAVHTYTGMAGTAYAMAIDEAENIYLAGYVQNASYDFAVIKLDSALSEQWVYSYNGPGNGEDRAYAICVIDAENIYAAGYTTGIGTGPDFTVMKLGVIVGAEEEPPPSIKDEDVRYPTIFSGPIKLPHDKKYRVLDITGRQVDVNCMVPGIYFIEVNGRVTRKVIKIK